MKFENLKQAEEHFEGNRVVVQQALIEGLQSFNFVDTKASLKNKFSRYKVASAMQKAIRRGHTDLAVKYAQAIYNSEERDYLWRRLPIIAFEDVGFGNLEAVAITCFACRFKAVRNNFDGLELVSYLAYALASRGKSRAFTEVLVLGSETKRAYDKSLSYQDMTPLEKSFCETKNAMRWYTQDGEYCQFKYLTEGMKDKLEVYQEVEDLSKNVSASVLPFLKYSFICGCKMSVEMLHCSIPYLLTLTNPKDFDEPEYINTPIPAPEFIGRIAEYAWDNHVSEGGRAYKEFYRKLNALNGVKVNYNAFKEIMFYVDISLVDLEFLFKDSQQIKLDSYLGFVEKEGVDSDTFFEVVGLIQENFDMLRQIRKDIIE